MTVYNRPTVVSLFVVAVVVVVVIDLHRRWC